MCVIIYAPPGEGISKDVVKQAIGSNPQGFGVWSYKDGRHFLSRGFGDAKAWKAWTRAGKENPRVLHARISTGGQVNIENTHPFYATCHRTPEKVRLFFHNGTIRQIPIVDRTKCDSWHFAQYLQQFESGAQMHNALVNSAREENSRYLLVENSDKEGELPDVKIFGKQWFICDGVYYSNLSALRYGNFQQPDPDLCNGPVCSSENFGDAVYDSKSKLYVYDPANPPKNVWPASKVVVLGPSGIHTKALSPQIPPSTQYPPAQGPGSYKTLSQRHIFIRDNTSWPGGVVLEDPKKGIRRIRIERVNGNIEWRECKYENEKLVSSTPVDGPYPDDVYHTSLAASVRVPTRPPYLPEVVGDVMELPVVQTFKLPIDPKIAKEMAGEKMEDRLRFKLAAGFPHWVRADETKPQAPEGFKWVATLRHSGGRITGYRITPVVDYPGAEAPAIYRTVGGRWLFPLNDSYVLEEDFVKEETSWPWHYEIADIMLMIDAHLDEEEQEGFLTKIIQGRYEWQKKHRDVPLAKQVSYQEAPL